jgi:CRISPR-associated protein Cas2
MLHNNNSQQSKKHLIFGGWRSMWLMVCFDLPSLTIQDKRNYIKFRKMLYHNGFNRLQFSIYARHTSSIEHCNTYEQIIQRNIPPNGHIKIFTFTDKQFGMQKTFFGRRKINNPKSQQLSLFI